MVGTNRENKRERNTCYGGALIGKGTRREKGRIRNVWLWWALIGKGKRREKEIYVMCGH